MLRNVGTGCGGTRLKREVAPRRFLFPTPYTHKTAPRPLHVLPGNILRHSEAGIYNLLRGMQRLIVSPWVGGCLAWWFLASLRGKKLFLGADFLAKSGYKSPGAECVLGPLPTLCRCKGAVLTKVGKVMAKKAPSTSP